jgi:hypothetical protein
MGKQNLIQSDQINNVANAMEYMVLKAEVKMRQPGGKGMSSSLI